MDQPQDELEPVVGGWQEVALPCAVPSPSCWCAHSHSRSIQEGLRQAKKAGDDKKLGMVASRK